MNIKDIDTVKDGNTKENHISTIERLHQQLANHYVLVTKTKFYHWNVSGSHFHDLHILFDEHYEVISDIVDSLAEQCQKLGGRATGTLQRFLDEATVKEDGVETIPDTKEMVTNLIDAHEIIMQALTKDIKDVDEKFDDAVTSNMLQDISDKHHKMTWMLRKIVQKSDLV